MFVIQTKLFFGGLREGGCLVPVSKIPSQSKWRHDILEGEISISDGCSELLGTDYWGCVDLQWTELIDFVIETMARGSAAHQLGDPDKVKLRGQRVGKDLLLIRDSPLGSARIQVPQAELVNSLCSAAMEFWTVIFSAGVSRRLTKYTCDHKIKRIHELQSIKH